MTDNEITSSESETGIIEERFFPRGVGIPKCTPAFFAQHKERFLRQLMIRDIEDLTGRRLLVAFSNPDRRPGFRTRDQEGFLELLSDLDHAENYDLLIESPGGETDVAESIVTMLQHCAGSFRAIVPGHAKSNATLLALAATEIVMLPSSEIGPIDPLIGGKPANVLMDKRLEDSSDLHERILFATADRAIAHTKKIATELLSQGMMRDNPEAVDEVVEKLCQTHEEPIFHSHGATICADQAKRLGLKVEKIPYGNRLERKLVYLHAMYRQDCRNLKYDKLYETSRVSNIHVYGGKPGVNHGTN